MDQALVNAETKYGTPDNPSPLSTATQDSMTGSTPGASLSDIVPGYQAPNASSVPPGYMMWQGQLIPAGLYRALQQSGELF
jgi:hypothetical protein